VYIKVGVLLVYLGSSPAQQNIAQPRQVRKEATVSNQFRVTQGNLTSFFVDFLILKADTGGL